MDAKENSGSKRREDITPKHKKHEKYTENIKTERIKNRGRTEEESSIDLSASLSSSSPRASFASSYT
jgi:hypothetical protein